MYKSTKKLQLAQLKVSTFNKVTLFGPFKCSNLLIKELLFVVAEHILACQECGICAKMLPELTKPKSQNGVCKFHFIQSSVMAIDYLTLVSECTDLAPVTVHSPRQPGKCS